MFNDTLHVFFCNYIEGPAAVVADVVLDSVQRCSDVSGKQPRGGSHWPGGLGNVGKGLVSFPTVLTARNGRPRRVPPGVTNP
jgi:hypothetical protein